MINNETAHIFIDEYGNTALNVEKTGTFSHFVYCSVIINSKDREKAEALRKNIVKNNNLGDNIKSSNIGDKYFDRRLKILKELVNGLDFTIDVLVIDKSKLDTAEGLKSKQIFYKYFQNLFVKKYADRFEQFTIWADKVGEAFQYELQDYIRNKSITPTLFNPNRFFYLSDDISQEKLIQLADIICGSVGKLLCSSHIHERANEIFEILHTRMSIEYFPFQSNISEPNIPRKNEHDSDIVEITLKLAHDHIDSLRGSDNMEEVRLLEYLVLNYRINPTRLIPTHEINSHLANFFSGITDEKIRTLVRNLRYDGIFIISHPGKPGYKLANSYWDITQQFEHYLKYVIPMLKKVKILNSAIADQSFNAINILESDKTFIELRQMLTGIK